MQVVQFLLATGLIAYSWAADAEPQENHLKCLECTDAKDEADCQRKGKVRTCMFNQDACQIELRQHEGWGGGYRIYKHCKQSWACDNNHIQNPRPAWYPTQCNPEDFNSVCRCCCFTDMCNIAFDSCFGPTGCPKISHNTPNGYVTCTDGNNYGSVCTVTCLGSSKYTGPIRAVCQTDGNWSNRLSGCIDKQCPPMTTLVNGYYFCTKGQQEGSLCRPYCLPGYVLMGQRLIHCSNGRWNIFDPPRCVELKCPDRGNVTGGRVICTDGNNVQSHCDVVCDDNRKLEGIVHSYCQDDGRWSHPLPTCELILCDPRGTIKNGVVSCSNGVQVSSECVATCKDGYRIEGVNTSVCLNTGHWSEPLPKCVPIECKNRGKVDNGKVTCSNENFAGSVCKVVCEPGSRLVGTEESECLDTGFWSDPLPKCEKIKCPVRGTVDFGVVSCTNKRFVGSVCTVKCNRGYEVVGVQVSRCLITGEWSDPLPVCEPVTCTDRTLENGEITCTDGVEVDSVCDAACNEGFKLVGSTRAICLPDGTWSRPLPKCVPIVCPVRVRLENGVVDCTDANNYGSVCTATCNPGYELVGVSVSNCLITGRWDKPLPTCTPIVCPVRVDLENGAVDCTNENNYGSVCTSRCNPGYGLVGVAVSECLITGRWDRPLPVCVPNQCTDQGTLEFGTIDCTDDENVGSVCTFQCTGEGYKLQPGDRERMTNECEEDGTWSDPKPCCARPCPSYAIKDIAIAFPADTSISDENWNLLIKFLTEKILDPSNFIVTEEAGNFAFFGYSDDVDRSTQIFLNTSPDESYPLTLELAEITRQGTGNDIGVAISHAAGVTFTAANGDRPGVQNVLVIIVQEGAAMSDAIQQANALRERGAKVVAVGIDVGTWSNTETENLREVAGGEENLFIMNGFSGFDDDAVLNFIGRAVCGDPCA